MKNSQLLSILIYIITIVLPLSLTAGDGIIRGRVFNMQNNEPLAFVNLIISGTTTGSTTDFEGNFILTNVEPGFVRIEVSAIGFERRITEEIMIGNDRAAFVEIGMKEIFIDLQAVEIVASPFERRAESPVSLRRLGIQQIERSPGSNRDISKVIQSLPGVALTPAFRNDVIIRGGGPSENRFFLDGIEIPNINHFSTQGASGGPVGIINVDFIREVEMYSGAFPANRGNALSSIFEFRQKNGNRDRLNLRATVGASDLAVALDGPLTENTSVIFSARRSYLQFLFDIIGLPFLPTYNGFQFKTNTRLTPDSELNIVGIGAIDQFSLNLDANETPEQRFLLDFLPVNEQWNYALGATYRRFRSNGSDLFVLSRNMLRNSSHKYPGNDESLARSLDYVSDEIENKFRFERNTNIFDNYALNFGFGGEYAKFNANNNQLLFQNNQLIRIQNQTQFDMFKWSVFGQITSGFFNDRLTLSFGARADANNFTENMSNLLQQFSPRFSASYRLRGNLFASANIGRYYQMPSYVTLGFVNPEGEMVNKLNNLSYISANHYVAGIEWLPDPLSQITVEGFYKVYGNYPFSVRDSVVIGSQSTEFGVFGNEEVVSKGRGRAFGAELLFRSENLQNFNLFFAYTFVRSDFQDILGKYMPSRWDNRHLLTFTAMRQLGRNWEIGIKWQFSGGAPFTPFDMEKSSLRSAWDAQNSPYLDYSRFHQERFDSFHNLDLRIDRTFSFRNFTLMAYLDIQNIYNFKSQLADIVVRDTDENGQPIVFTDNNGDERYLLRAIENRTGTILPSIGLIFEF
ncbi:MAG TPA: carboxypeptidase-like regulatory domain-containing protein [Bacteroidales bacterium]|nr:carboxypeptidase-like regulatory domain-containing protein [Bacteroidales bacterium]